MVSAVGACPAVRVEEEIVRVGDVCVDRCDGRVGVGSRVQVLHRRQDVLLEEEAAVVEVGRNRRTHGKGRRDRGLHLGEVVVVGAALVAYRLAHVVEPAAVGAGRRVPSARLEADGQVGVDADRRGPDRIDGHRRRSRAGKPLDRARRGGGQDSLESAADGRRHRHGGRGRVRKAGRVAEVGRHPVRGLHVVLHEIGGLQRDQPEAVPVLGLRCVIAGEVVRDHPQEVLVDVERVRGVRRKRVLPVRDDLVVRKGGRKVRIHA